MGKQKKKPKNNWFEVVESVVTILAGLADIGFILYQIFKG